MFADPDALNSWRSDESADGLADLAFWGRYAIAVAQRFDAAVIESPNGRDIFGWTDQHVADIGELGHELADLRRNPELKFAFDFRPHDDHYRLLTAARVSPTESATIEVAGMQVTGFFTSWGDGAFPVFRDVAADGQPAGSASSSPPHESSDGAVPVGTVARPGRTSQLEGNWSPRR